jgi:hypothetical protein
MSFICHISHNMLQPIWPSSGALKLHGEIVFYTAVTFFLYFLFFCAACVSDWYIFVALCVFPSVESCADVICY